MQSGVLGELDPLIGLTISGRYRVHALLGQGGMGKVFLAQQIPLGREVALKVLDARRVDPEFNRRFFQEAAILAKLKSRHTVTIYDYGRDGELYFIAMELVPGESLDRVLASSAPLEVQRTLKIAEQICRSLREAHAQGVIHRDLKPGNVMLTHAEDGEELVKVLDFGLAKRLNRGASEETKSDRVPGSPKYMAPELVRLQPIDGRADMYGLGVMLYYMLTGAVPFDYDNPMDILVAHMQQPPRPFAQVSPSSEIPEALEQLVMRCLAKTPEERFADMQELHDQLRAIEKSLSRPSRSSQEGMRDPATSGVRWTPSLRLEAKDAAGPTRPSLGLPMSRAANGPWIAGIAGLLLLAGFVAWRAAGSHEPPLPPVPQPRPAPAATAPAAPPEAAATPNMVITPEEAANNVAPRVTLKVSSEPSGASVIVHGKSLGTTPLSFDLRDSQAKPGAQLVLLLKREGYLPYTIKRTIDAAELELSARLEPVPSELPPAPPSNEPHATEAPQRAISGAATEGQVLKITPAEREIGPQQAQDEPDTEQPEDEPTGKTSE
jgi:serine/threonine-protein kinase